MTGEELIDAIQRLGAEGSTIVVRRQGDTHSVTPSRPVKAIFVEGGIIPAREDERPEKPYPYPLVLET